MQRERQGRNELFDIGDPFGSFWRFGRMPSLFGGRDPFDDPFFTRPFGSMFESSRFEQAPSSATGKVVYNDSAKAVVIEELASDDEGEGGEVKTGDEKNSTEAHRDSNKEPSVEHPDDDDHDGFREGDKMNRRNESFKTGRTEPQGQRFSFRSCKVTYGGVDGAYYTSSRTKRAGSGGVVIEESKEADKTTGQATHNISRGIHDKGHSVTRKLNSDGVVDTVQTLHNLNEDELIGFEEVWNDNHRGQLPGWGSQFDMHGATGSNSSGRWRGWLPPSNAEGRGSDRGGGTKKVVRINVE